MHINADTLTGLVTTHKTTPEIFTNNNNTHVKLKIIMITVHLFHTYILPWECVLDVDADDTTKDGHDGKYGTQDGNTSIYLQNDNTE